MIENGGKIGTDNSPTVSLQNGVWNPREQRYWLSRKKWSGAIPFTPVHSYECNDGRGTTLVDTGSSPSNGTLSGGEYLFGSWSTFGKYLRINTCTIDFGTTWTASTLQPMTFSMLYKNGYQNDNLCYSIDGSNNGFAISIDSGDNFSFIWYKDGDYITSSYDLGGLLTNFTHLAVTYDGSKSAAGITLYVDGVSMRASQTDATAGTIPDTITSGVNVFSQFAGTSGAYASGAKIKLFDTALTPTQVAELYQNDLVQYI